MGNKYNKKDTVRKTYIFRSSEPGLQDAIELYSSTNLTNTTTTIKELLGYGVSVWLQTQYDE